MSVCMCVRLSVCVISTAQTDGTILMKLCTNDLEYLMEQMAEGNGLFSENPKFPTASSSGL